MRRSFLVACLAAFAASSTIPARADIQWLHSWDQAQQLARKTGKPIFVDMVTDWCVWCKRMDTYVYPTRTAQAAMANVIPLKLDAERAGYGLARRFDVHSFPTSLVLDDKGELLGRLSGYLKPEDLSLALTEVAKDRRDEKTYKSRLSANPRDFKALCGMSKISIDRGSLDGAVRYAQRAAAAKRGPSTELANCFERIGEAYYATKRPDLAAPAFELAAKRASGQTQRIRAELNRAGSLLACGDRGGAIYIARDVLHRKAPGPDAQQRGQAEAILEASNR